jgi:putative cell wall-binding protein
MKKTIAVSVAFAMLVIAPLKQAMALPSSITAIPQGSSTVVVNWSGSGSYDIEAKVGGDTGTVVQRSSVNGTSYTFTGLLSGTTYTFVLRDGSAAVTTSATTTSIPWGAPVDAKATSSCVGRLAVQWSPPSVLGSLPLLGYRVTATWGAAGRATSFTAGQSVELSGFESPTDNIAVTIAAVDTSGDSPNLAQFDTNTISAACPLTDTDPGGDSDSDGSPGGGGGGGGSSASDGEALPGVPKSLAGADRVATSIAVAEADFLPATTNPTAQSATLRAQAAVIASSASFPDALAAGPLAYAKVAPLLLTGKNSLDSRIGTALTKLVPAGSTVYIVGGEAAVSANVATAITKLGFTVQRIAGVDRYDTSVKVAQALGNPSKAYAATGLDFPDALAAGVVAARQSGAILLTRGGEIPVVVAGYLLENPNVVVTAVGGPAASAFPAATSYKGADRYATAVELAKAFPLTSVTAGVASGLNYPDGLVAAPYLARRGGVLLLTQQLVVPSATSNYIKATTKIDVLQVFGGLSVVSDTARRTLATHL